MHTHEYLNSPVDREDPFDISDNRTEAEVPPAALRTRRSLPQLFLQPTSPVWEPRAFSAVDRACDEAEFMPLVSREGKGKGRSKSRSKRKKFERILGNLSFRKRKTSQNARENDAPMAISPDFTTTSALFDRTLPALDQQSDTHVGAGFDFASSVAAASARSLHNPFGDENAMVCDHREQEHGVDGFSHWPATSIGARDDGSPTMSPRRSSVSSGVVQWALLPQTPRKSSFSTSGSPSRSTASPTTPRSTRSRLTIPTPSPAKSWLSEISASSELSAISSLRRKHAKRKARLTSEMKSIQVLGAEAAGAVAKAGRVSETKLHFRMLERQVRDELRRLV